MDTNHESQPTTLDFILPGQSVQYTPCGKSHTYHPEDWPVAGAISIEKCERQCRFRACKAWSQTAAALRKHVHAHIVHNKLDLRILPATNGREPLKISQEDTPIVPESTNERPLHGVAPIRPSPYYSYSSPLPFESDSGYASTPSSANRAAAEEDSFRWSSAEKRSSSSLSSLSLRGPKRVRTETGGPRSPTAHGANSVGRFLELAHKNRSSGKQTWPLMQPSESDSDEQRRPSTVSPKMVNLRGNDAEEGRLVAPSRQLSHYRSLSPNPSAKADAQRKDSSENNRPLSLNQTKLEEPLFIHNAFDFTTSPSSWPLYKQHTSRAYQQPTEGRNAVDTDHRHIASDFVLFENNEYPNTQPISVKEMPPQSPDMRALTNPFHPESSLFNLEGTSYCRPRRNISPTDSPSQTQAAEIIQSIFSHSDLTPTLSHNIPLTQSRKVPSPERAEHLRCSTCNRYIKTKSELKKHHLRHSKPFTCSFPGCSRQDGFSSSNDLDRHTKSKHHNPKDSSASRYTCHFTGCKSKDKVWPRLDNFRSHLKRVHSHHSTGLGIENTLRGPDVLAVSSHSSDRATSNPRTATALGNRPEDRLDLQSLHVLADSAVLGDFFSQWPLSKEQKVDGRLKN